MAFLFLIGASFEALAATVTYTMQTGNFNSRLVEKNNNPGYAGIYNNSATELGLYSNGGSFNNTPGAAAFETFTTTGNGTSSGSVRALQVGDTFTITGFTSANPSSGGYIGISFRDSTTYSNFFSATDNTTEARFQLDNTGGWKVYNGGTAVDSGFGANTDRTFTIKITSENTFNATIGGTTYYDLSMAAGGGTIDSFAIYTYGDSNQNSFWKNASLSDTGTVELGNDLASGSRTISGIISDGLNADSTSTVRANAVTVSGGSGSWVVLSAANTYTGQTTVNANASLEVQNAASLGSVNGNTVVNSGGTLRLWNGGAGFTTAAEALTLNGAGVSSGGALRNVLGNNTYAGVITLASGSRINSDSGILTLDVASGNAITGTYQLNIGGNGNVTVNDNINISTAKLVKDGAGVLTLGASNNYSGNTEVDAGEIWFATGGSANSSKIWIGNGASTGTTAKVWIQSGGTTISSAIEVNNGTANTRVLGGLNTSGTATYSGSIGVNNGDLNLEANNAGGTVEFTGTVTTSAGKYITASGPGLVIFSGSGNNTGIGANVNSGTLQLAKTSSSSVSALNASPIVNNGGKLQLAGTGGNQIADSASVTVNSGGTFDLNGRNETISAITLNGTGSGSSGSLINSSGTASTLTLSANSSLGSASTIGGTGDITIDGSGSFRMTGGATTLTKVGSNTLTLSSGASSDNLNLILQANGGTTVLDKTGTGANGAHAVGGMTVNSGATVKLGGTGNYQIYEGATPTVNSGGTFDMNGKSQTFTSSGITVSGTGVSNGGALVNSSTATTSTLASSVILNADSALGGAGDLNVSGVISGSTKALTKVGTGTLTLSGANTYSGGTTISAGTLKLDRAGNGTGGTISGSIAVNGGTLLLGQANQIADGSAVTLAGGTLNTGSFADQAGVLKVSSNSAISGLKVSTGAGVATGNDFLFSSVDLTNYATSSGAFLDLGGGYTLGSTINFASTQASLANGWTGYSTTSLNNFQDKIKFGDTGMKAQISFNSTTSLTYVTAIPEPKVYVAAGILCALVGLTEYRRRKRATRVV